MYKRIIKFVFVYFFIFFNVACSGDIGFPNNEAIDVAADNQSSNSLESSNKLGGSDTDAEQTQVLDSGTTIDAFAAVKPIDSCPNKDCRRMKKKVPPQELWCKSGYKSCSSNGVTIKSQ